jgi:hypothetical protein
MMLTAKLLDHGETLGHRASQPVPPRLIGVADPLDRDDPLHPFSLPNRRVGVRDGSAQAGPS